MPPGSSRPAAGGCGCGPRIRAGAARACQAYMHAATERPTGRDGFSRVEAAGLELWFLAPAGSRPDVLEIGMKGRRRPRVEAYWDGCLFALNG